MLTLPMFPALRARFPNAVLVLFTRSYVRDLIEGLSCIDEVVYTDSGAAKTDSGAAKTDSDADNTANDAFDLRNALASRRIDTVFFPRATFKEAWAAFRAGVHTRVGTANRWYSLLYNHPIREHRSHSEYHEAEYNVRMISHTFGLPQPDVHLVSPLTKPAPSPTIVVHPGSGGSSPQWPAECFGEAARRLHEVTGLNIVVTGVASELDLCARVVAMCPGATNACGAYTLGEMLSVIGGARVLLANATGTLHVAASLGTPVVGFYPNSVSISARRWRPYTSNARVLISKANDDMSTISIDEAVQASVDLLAENAA